MCDLPDCPRAARAQQLETAGDDDTTSSLIDKPTCIVRD